MKVNCTMALLSRRAITSYHYAKRLVRLLTRGDGTSRLSDGFVRTLANRSGSEHSEGSPGCVSTEPRKAPPLVSTAWLQARVIEPHPNFRILDGSWQRSTGDRNALREYQESHIPGALFFDIHECSDQTSPYKAMLPSPGDFENYVSKLGIDNNTHVVVYDNNATYGMFSAQRVWWMFRVFGHSMVSVLDGGLPKWVKENRITTAEVAEVKESGRSSFKASFNAACIKTYEQMQRNVTTEEFTVLDARSAASFEGTAPVTSSGIGAGHIPGSVNIPYASLLNPETKTFKERAQLEEEFAKMGMDLSVQVAASCGSGITGCMLIFAAHICGREDVPLYDGSWTEWAQRAPPHLKATGK